MSPVALFSVFCAFVLCLAPYAVNLCLYTYTNSPQSILYTVAVVLSNSCINPLIYATKHRDFQTVFRCIVRRRWDDIPQPSDFLKFMQQRRCCRRGTQCDRMGPFI